MDIPFRNKPSARILEPYKPKHFLIGLDYGTTNSSGVFCLASQETYFLQTNKVHPFERYSAANQGEKSSNTEIPTVIKYDRFGIKYGQAALKREVPAGTVIKQAKLGLDADGKYAEDRAKLHRALEDLVNQQEDCGFISEDSDEEASPKAQKRIKKPQHVTADFLAELFTAWREELLVKGYDYRDVLELHCTVPAAWKTSSPIHLLDRAIKRASKKAGLEFEQAIRFWYEPEAALAQLIQHNNLICPDVDQCALIVDGGGGTVDLTMHRVIDRESLELEEVLPPMGDNCGSAVLEANFRSHTLKRIAHLTQFQESRKRTLLDNATDQFRREIKPLFAGKPNESHLIDFYGLDADDDQGFMEDILCLNRTNLIEIFDPVIQRIWVMIEDMLRQASLKKLNIQLLALVGGFSGSPYLRKFIQNKLGNSLQVEYPLTSNFAVAEGAIYCELYKAVGNRRINRCSIGFEHYAIWDNKHRGHPKGKDRPNIDPRDGKRWVRCVSWFVKKGEPRPTERKRIALHRVVSMNSSEPFEFGMTLVRSESNVTDGYWVGHPINEDCEVWESIFIKTDIEQFKEKLTPQYRKPRTRKVTRETDRASLRRSARIMQKTPTTNVFKVVPQHTCPTSSLPAADSMYKLSAPIPENENESENDTVTDPNEQQDESTCSEQEINGSEGWLTIDYSLEIDFGDLLAKYTLVCEEANIRQPGVVSLTPVYEPGKR